MIKRLSYCIMLTTCLNLLSIEKTEEQKTDKIDPDGNEIENIRAAARQPSGLGFIGIGGEVEFAESAQEKVSVPVQKQKK